MAAPVDRPTGVLAGTFGVGILTFLLLPSEIGYQDLAALIARDVATLQRPQKASLTAQFGTTRGDNLNLSQAAGSSIKPPIEFTLAGLDPNSAEITGSLRERILRESNPLFAPEGSNPWVDRSRKGDQLTIVPRKNENVAVKGDRLPVPPVQQAEAEKPDAEVPAQQVAVAPTDAPVADEPARQVADAPAAEAPEAAPPVTVVESQETIDAEKQLAEQVEQAAQTRQAAAQQPNDEAEPRQQAERQPTEDAAPTREAKAEPKPADSKPAERIAETKQTPPKRVEKPGRTRTAQSSRRAQRLARAEREEQRRAERAARNQEARQKAAEKVARAKEAAKTARVQDARKDAAKDTPKAPAAQIARTPEKSPQPAEQIAQEQNALLPAEAAAVPAEPVVQAAAAAQPEPAQPQSAEAQPQPDGEQQPKTFVVASAGDHRIGLDTRKFERDSAPAIAAPAEVAGTVETAVAKGKADALKATAAFVAAEGNVTQRTSRLFFNVDPMGRKLGAIEPWTPGSEPRLDGEVKLAALPPADSATDVPSVRQEISSEQTALPADANQSVSKDPSARGGETIAPKGEVTGADKRPMSPAERLGLNDEKSRAKSVKCLTEVIYFESRGEQVRGQMAVAQVVLNRAFSGKYPNTVCGVVYQNAHRHLACQFTFACDGIPDRVKEPDMWERATVIANEMLDGKIWLPEVGKATHYHAHWVHPGWVREMTKLHRLGVHTFYRPRAWGDGTDAPQWGDVSETQEVAKKLVEVAKKP